MMVSRALQCMGTSVVLTTSTSRESGGCARETTKRRWRHTSTNTRSRTLYYKLALAENSPKKSGTYGKSNRRGGSSSSRPCDTRP